MRKEQIAGLEAIKNRISYKYSVLENLKKEMKRKAKVMYEIEQDIKRLEMMQKWMNTNITNNSDRQD